MLLSSVFSAVVADNILLAPTQITNLTSAVAVFALGLFIYLRKPKDAVNLLAFVMSLFLGFWAMSSTLADVMHEAGPALFWTRVAIIGPFFFPAFFLIFTYYFPVPSGRMRWWKAALILLPSLVVLMLVNSELNVASVRLADWGTDFTPGPLYPIGILYQILYTVISVVILIRSRKRTTEPIVRKQINLVVFMIILVTFCQFFINALLPALFNYAQATVFGPATSFFFVLVLSYTIFRHGLLNLKIIATESFAVLLIFISFVQMFWAGSALEFVSRVAVLLATVFVGLMLIRSVRQEISRREEVQHLAAELSASNKRLRQLDDLKTTMVSIASHQIRGPLGGIRGYLTMFRDGDLGPINDKQKEIVTLNLNVSTRLLNAVETFLDITKLESGKLTLRKEVLPLDDAVIDVVEEFKLPAQKKGLGLAVSIDCPRPVWVDFDPDKIKHVIFNLIDNAMKYTDKGKIDVRVRCDGHEAVLEVTDTGMGIPPEDASRLFGKFERGELVIDRGGSGLGLYVIKMLTEMQGGRVWATSPGVGKGSTFSVALPLSRDIPKE